jgi:hypothetical protein
VEARVLLGVLERPVVRAHGLGRPGPSRVPRDRPILEIPQDVQGSRTPLQPPPTRSTRRCATRCPLAPLRCQRRVASRNYGARVSCHGRPPTRSCRDGARRRAALARAARMLHARPVLPHGSQACLRRARPRWAEALCPQTEQRGTHWPGCDYVPGVSHAAWRAGLVL